MKVYHRIVRPALFRFDPETIHGVTVRALELAGRVPLGLRWLAGRFDYRDPRLESEVFGLRFRNPVGLAAGYLKNGRAVRELAALGFGHLEVGTVTPLPQAGNPRPRVFRLPEDGAVINRMGFPNDGAEALLSRLKRYGSGEIRAQVGVNIGKGCDTPIEEAFGDYERLLRQFHPYSDYVAVNVSSPNTPGLRKLQGKALLESLLGQLARLKAQLCPETPLLVKIAPDLTLAEIDDVLDVAGSCGIAGIIATNTTVSREGLTGPRPARSREGGLSGVPLRQTATEIVRYIYRQTAGSLPIIGVGGVDSAESALEKIRAGASLAQVYTGLVYQGPGLVRAINQGLAGKLEELGADSLGQLVGTEA